MTENDIEQLQQQQLQQQQFQQKPVPETPAPLKPVELKIAFVGDSLSKFVGDTINENL